MPKSYGVYCVCQGHSSPVWFEACSASLDRCRAEVNSRPAHGLKRNATARQSGVPDSSVRSIQITTVNQALCANHRLSRLPRGRSDNGYASICFAKYRICLHLSLSRQPISTNGISSPIADFEATNGICRSLPLHSNSNARGSRPRTLKSSRELQHLTSLYPFPF